MIYDIYHLGYLSVGQYVSVKVNQTAHLILIDELNLPKYRTNQLSYLAFDVLQLIPAAAYPVPYSAAWHLILEIGELPSLTTAAVEIIGFSAINS